MQALFLLSQQRKKAQIAHAFVGQPPGYVVSFVRAQGGSTQSVQSHLPLTLFCSSKGRVYVVRPVPCASLTMPFSSSVRWGLWQAFPSPITPAPVPILSRITSVSSAKSPFPCCVSSDWAWILDSLRPNIRKSAARCRLSPVALPCSRLLF